MKRLFWRVFVANAAVLAAGTLVLVLSPATVSRQPELTEAIILVVGGGAMLLINLLLLRPVFRPLERLAAHMQTVDLLRPGERIASGGGSQEIAALEQAFDAMLARLETERREASRRALAAQEEERQRIARGLHDEVGQAMTGVLFQLKRLAAGASPEQQEQIAQAQQTVRTSLEEVRRIAQELRPELLDHLGLISALTSLARSFSQRTGIQVETSLPAELPPLDRDAEVTLYRVAQEGLTNVARHAGARSAQLSLAAPDGRLALQVADDGRGFELPVMEGGGLRGIRERALIVGGTASVGNGPRGGAVVRLELPLDG
jgi:two-component system, NarL family, sensor histidine kinase UhpB